MNLIEFKDAEIYNLDCTLEKVRKNDTWCLVGDGVLITKLNEREADELKKLLTNWFKKRRIQNK